MSIPQSCFDHIILRGYILCMFFPAGVVKFLRVMGFKKLSNGVMRILTDQLNAHILKVAQARNIPIHWWPPVDGGKDGAKQKFVQEKYARLDDGTGDRLYCILTYFNGHNAIQVQLDKRGVHYRRHDNAFVDVDDPEAIRKAVESLHGRAVLNRVTYWMNLFFKFDKGKYSTCFKYLLHDWYLSQVEISSNIVFRSARFGNHHQSPQIAGAQKACSLSPGLSVEGCRM